MRFLDQPPLVDSHVEFIQLPIDSSDDTDLVMSSSGFDNSKDLPKTTSEFIVEIQSPITASNCFTTTNSQSTNEYDPSSVLVIKEEKTISEIPPTASPKGRFRDGIYKKEKSEDEPGFTNPVSQLTETELETKCRLEKCIASLNIQTSKPAVIYDAIREIQSTLSSDRALRINLKEIKLASSLMRFLKTLNRSPPHLRLAHICLALINDVMVIPEVKPTMFLRPKSAEFWVQRLQSYGKHEDLLINCLKTIIYGCEEPQFLKVSLEINNIYPFNEVNFCQ